MRYLQATARGFRTAVEKASASHPVGLGIAENIARKKAPEKGLTPAAVRR